MAIELFAGIYVSDCEAAKAWYLQVFGSEPSFLPNATEAVWEIAEHRWIYIEEHPNHAGHAVNTVLVDDLEARLAAISQRGLEPARLETYDNGMRKIVYRDPDGNEIGFGGVPPEA